MTLKPGKSHRDHGLTDEQWHAILVACGWHCPACGKPFSASRPPACDHDHLTGLVRGALCLNCNYAIGERHDMREWFANVATYLESPPAVAVIGKVYQPGSPGAEGELDDGQ